MRTFMIILVMITVTGCATIPPGPSVMVIPAPGKPFELFQREDAACRQWAEYQSGWNANETVNENLVSGAAIGTLLGAGLGAAIGSGSGHTGTGAAIGAAGGMAIGAAGASDPARTSGLEVQRRYDIAYQQCMYSKGNQIPGLVQEPRKVRYLPPPPPGYEPMPYDGSPPPDYNDGSYPPY